MGCCTFLVLLISGILVGCSFRRLDPTEMGVAYNTLSKTIEDDRVYTSGRYWLGIARDFFRYPRTQQVIEFKAGGDAAPLITRSEEGQVTIECSLHLVLNMHEIVDLYRSFELNWKSQFVRFAANAIQNTASSIRSAETYYKDRQGVNDLFLQALRREFQGRFSTVVDFQLRKVSLPQSVESAIISRTVRREQERTETLRSQTEQINGRVSVLESEGSSNRSVIQQESDSKSQVILREATATANELRLDVTGRAYTALKERLGMESNDIMRYIYLKHLGDASRQETIAAAFPEGATVFHDGG